MKNVLITGASGYIGKHVTLQLLNQGYTVRASVRNLAKSAEVRDAVLPHLLDSSNLDSRLIFVELDLEKDSGWDKALHDIDVLMHTASPFPLAAPKDENELIRPAVDGTLRALKAAKSSGVKRVILTSSMAAIYGRELPAGAAEYDETMWTDVTHPVGSGAYTKSKTLAERILKGSDPMLPDLKFAIVDVRDVATMHVDAIKMDETKGERILSSSETKSFVEIAKYLKSIYPKSKVKSIQAPTAIIKFLSIFDSTIKTILPQLGKPMRISNAKAKRLMGMSFIPAEVILRDSADYLVKNGFIKS